MPPIDVQVGPQAAHNVPILLMDGASLKADPHCGDFFDEYGE